MKFLKNFSNALSLGPSMLINSSDRQSYIFATQMLCLGYDIGVEYDDDMYMKVMVQVSLYIAILY